MEVKQSGDYVNAMQFSFTSFDWLVTSFPLSLHLLRSELHLLRRPLHHLSWQLAPFGRLLSFLSRRMDAETEILDLSRKNEEKHIQNSTVYDHHALL